MILYFIKTKTIVCMCVYCAVGPEVIGHYDVSDTHSEQEQQLHTLSGQWIANWSNRPSACSIKV